MGLDMYLYERTFCPNVYRSKGKNYQTNFTTKMWNYGEKPECEKRKFNDVAFITCRKGYWRKANAINRFFLDKCGRGLPDDDLNGRDLFVRDEYLVELRDICFELLKLKGKKFKVKAQELLPTADGFFWGSTVYDKWYRDDLKRTIKIINKLNLDKTKDDWHIDYIYNADW